MDSQNSRNKKCLNGKVIFLTGTAQDITDRKITQEKLSILTYVTSMLQKSPMKLF